MNAECRRRYDAALTAARAAGQFALQHFDTGVAVEWKADQSPVTLADRGAEQLLRTTLLGQFPGDGFLGEESGETPGTSGFRWIIDPIDGTRSFVRGVPIWATLVGLEYQGDPVAGVAYLPAMNQVYHALRGDGAFRDGRRLRVSTVNNLAEAHVFYSSIKWFDKAGCPDQFLSLLRQTQRQRGFGDFYGFLLVAQGSGDLMIEYGVHAWDLAALVSILEEAGGKITDWRGVRDITRPDVLASNGLLHEEVLRLITFEEWSEPVRVVFKSARLISKELGHQEIISPLHLLLGLLFYKHYPFTGFEWKSIRHATNGIAPPFEEGTVVLSPGGQTPAAKQAITIALQSARNLATPVTIEHIYSALCKCAPDLVATLQSKFPATAIHE